MQLMHLVVVQCGLFRKGGAFLEGEITRMLFNLKGGWSRAGTDTGIHSGGCEILTRENYTKKEKGRLSILKLSF